MSTLSHVPVSPAVEPALGRLGRALVDPTRARVLRVLADGPQYPAALAEALGVSRQSMSNHLACLRGCGVVVAAREGRRWRYELADSRLGGALLELEQVLLVPRPEARSLDRECC